MCVFAVLILMLIIEVLWTFLAHELKLKRKYEKWRFINSVVFLASLAAILLITIFTREKVYVEPSFRILDGMLSLTMLRFVSESKIKHMALNVLLFFPIGLSMPFAYRLHRKYVVPFGFLISLFIECTQYFCLLGRFEVDDLLMNTMGVVIGAVPYFVYRQRRSYARKRIRRR